MKEFLKNITIRKYWFLKLLLNHKQTFLYTSGWIRSYKEKKPVDLAGNPKPWLSISSVMFLDERLTKNMRIFEYGAGNSTLYFSYKCLSVTSIEHNNLWYNKIKVLVNADNAKVYHYPLGASYTNSINQFDELYDIILVDGRMRIECTKVAFLNLSDKGVLILDDSHRERYQPAINHMVESGYSELKFWDVNLGGVEFKSTSIFYKPNNCLKI